MKEEGGEAKDIPTICAEVENIINDSHHHALGGKSPNEVVDLLGKLSASISDGTEAMQVLLKQKLMRESIIATQAHNAKKEKED